MSTYTTDGMRKLPTHVWKITTLQCLFTRKWGSKDTADGEREARVFMTYHEAFALLSPKQT